MKLKLNHIQNGLYLLYLSVFIYIFIYLSIYLSICISIYLSLYLYIYLSIYLSSYSIYTFVGSRGPGLDFLSPGPSWNSAPDGPPGLR